MTSRDSVEFRIPGVPLSAVAAPRMLGGGSRAASDPADLFLPEGFVEVVEAYDLTRAARDVAAAAPSTMAAQGGEVLVLELGEGVSIFTSPQTLEEVLERIDPASVGGGIADLDALRRHGQQTRGWVSDAVGELVERVFRVKVGAAADPILDAARHKLAEWLGTKAEEKLRDVAGLGVTWLGTKALMWAIESRLQREPGLYRWVGAQGEPTDLISVGDDRLAQEGRQGPMLVFIHGTGSNSSGSFGDLKNVSQEDWRDLQARFGDRIYAFEHRTFSESPIENALALARVLPQGAQISVVTHSRGGLVGDFLCLERVDDTLVRECFGDPDPRPGEDEGQRAVREARSHGYAEHRAKLGELAIVLREKRLRVDRYVRVASPARGTRLASANLDVFLSGLLSLIGLVPVLAASPLYSAVKRIVLEIAKNRTRPEMVPGIEAMLPDSPTARFLARSEPREGMQLAVIAGDIEGGGVLKKLGVLFTDYLFFDRVDNDLVVDTDSMYAGLARPALAHSRFEQGPKVNHFRYFENGDSRAALVEWLTLHDLTIAERFEPLPATPAERTAAQEAAADRDFLLQRGGERDEGDLPIVVMLPGIMGSHLRLMAGDDRIWFDPLDIVAGGLAKLRWTGEADDVAPDKLFDRFYGNLCEHLLQTHRVERFPYDWRKPVSVAANALAERIEALLEGSKDRPVPIRLLAHSMGGLVVRTMIAARPDLWEALNARPGARFVMLGTPNQGSHSMVATLLGKDETVRKLARFVDMKHDLQELLDIIKEFRGALQLLPRPGFDDAAGRNGQFADYYDPQLWPSFRDRNRDFWFGNGIVGAPTGDALGDAGRIWSASPEFAEGRLPSRHRENIVYVCGVAEKTPCGVRLEGDRWKMLSCAEGDGTVTWRSGLIGGLEENRNVYFLRAEHGALADTEEAFPALVELLAEGKPRATDVLTVTRPAARTAGEVLAYEPGPVPLPSSGEILDALAGSRRPRKARPAARPVLEVSCAAMDLRQCHSPVMVGHYEQDAISGAESLIDRELVGGELTMRHHLGLYAGRMGTATVVLFSRNDEERRRGSARGAVVIGLGELGNLTMGSLTEAARTGTLRYLLQLVDNQGGVHRAAQGSTDIGLSSLLIGHNSTTNISVEDSVGAIVRGVLEANQQFAETMKQPMRVTRLDLVEMYLDTAIGATRALQRVAKRLNADASRYGMRVQPQPFLTQRKGWHYRLDAPESNGYWPRLIVTDADVEGGRLPGDGNRSPARALKFLYLAQRARAETQEKQRQPGLIEALVSNSLTRTGYSEELSRTLFQLLIPNDFKEVARQLGRLVLVVDAYTANLPWELMLAEKEPLCVRAWVVRQLASGQYRSRVRQTLDPLALVVGNPSTKGFGKVFRSADGTPYPDPPALAGAENEARAVVQALGAAGFSVTEAIGTSSMALDVINKLYQRPYRIVHIASHGLFEQRAADGTLRTGAILSDGVLLTAAEIDSMEVVPDLVFLNCCHLAQTGAAQPGIAFNRLAYSISRQLIEMGVRAVVAAGWAVDDEAAEYFAAEFYGALLRDNRSLGEAAFLARSHTYERFGTTTNTWGAYQIYGDPGYVAQPQAMDRGSSNLPSRAPVVPEELLGAIERVSASISTAPGAMAQDAAARHAARAEKLLKDCPEAWGARPDVRYALGQLYGALGRSYFPVARDHFVAALQSTDRDRSVPTRAIEELVNLEARVADESDAAGLKAVAVSGRTMTPLELVESAIGRLEKFGSVIDGDGAPGPNNRERAALLGGACKRKAAIIGRALIARRPGARMEDLLESLERGIEAYETASGKPDDADYRSYIALNALGLRATELGPEPAPPSQRQEWLAQVRLCRERAHTGFRSMPDFWNAVMPADSAVVESIIVGDLAAAGQAGEETLQRLKDDYGEALSSVRGTPRELDSVVKQLDLLSLFLKVKSVLAASRTDATATARLSKRLAQLANHLCPGSCRLDDDEPVDPADSGEVGDAPKPGPVRKKTAKRVRPEPAPAKARKPATKKGASTKRK
ncbi:MAG: CHAT domain-containing protein [Betaproteobacteria bacterium]|nr:CHAT domain-containing protein [Betaproteobacteria bacterium]